MHCIGSSLLHCIVHCDQFRTHSLSRVRTNSIREKVSKLTLRRPDSGQRKLAAVQWSRSGQMFQGWKTIWKTWNWKNNHLGKHRPQIIGVGIITECANDRDPRKQRFVICCQRFREISNHFAIKLNNKISQCVSHENYILIRSAPC